MKKSLVVFAILSTVVLASCGGKGVSEEAADSTVVVDSTEVVADSLVVVEEELVGGAETEEVVATEGEAVK